MRVLVVEDEARLAETVRRGLIAEGSNPRRTVLMLTAEDGDYDMTDAFDLGADDYMTKPFSFIVLVARLRALIRRGASARPVMLCPGGLHLDPRT